MGDEGKGREGKRVSGSFSSLCVSLGDSQSHGQVETDMTREASERKGEGGGGKKRTEGKEVV